MARVAVACPARAALAAVQPLAWRTRTLPSLHSVPPYLLPAQVVLLDPVVYPGALKVFAREICKNDLLNFGRLHFFFPDSRLSLDLSTDRTLKVGGWGCRGLQPRPHCVTCSGGIHQQAGCGACT